MLEKTLSINSREVHYKTAGGGKPLLVLHGWGSAAAKWGFLGEAFEGSGWQLVLPDLPGFGNSDPPSEIWGVKEYAQWVLAFARELGIDRFALAGHSIGGQIALQTALLASERIEKLILIAPAAVRRGSGLREHVLRGFAKVIGPLIYIAPHNVRVNIRNIGYRMLRRPDYVRTYGIMREVFQKVIREDLRPFFPKVRVPTFLIWGTADRITPVADGRLMEKEIPGSQLVLLEGRGHNLHVEAPKELVKSIMESLKKS